MRVWFELSTNCDFNVAAILMLLDAKGGTALTRKMDVNIKPLGEIDSFLNHKAIQQPRMNVALGVLWPILIRLVALQIDPVDVTPSLRDALWSREQSATSYQRRVRQLKKENKNRRTKKNVHSITWTRLCVDFLVHYETDATKLKNLKVHSDTGTRLM